MNDIGFTERSFRLIHRGLYDWVWIFDDNGEIYKNKTFKTEKEAMDYMNLITSQCEVVRTKLPLPTKNHHTHLDCIGTNATKATTETIHRNN